jgi:hypothetical protein
VAKKLDITIEKGATFSLRLTRRNPDSTPLDLTGCTARMQIRQSVAAPEVLLELTTVNGKIVIDGPAGTIDLEISATETAALVATKPGRYDLEVVDALGKVKRLVEGSVGFSAEVTR